MTTQFGFISKYLKMRVQPPVCFTICDHSIVSSWYSYPRPFHKNMSRIIRQLWMRKRFLAGGAWTTRRKHQRRIHFHQASLEGYQSLRLRIHNPFKKNQKNINMTTLFKLARYAPVHYMDVVGPAFTIYLAVKSFLFASCVQEQKWWDHEFWHKS